jgi:hypothetical protein
MVQLVIPRLQRAQVRETDRQLAITVPPTRSLGNTLFGLVCLTACGGPFYYFREGIRAIPHMRTVGAGDILLISILILWAWIAFGQAYGLLFEFFGRERLVVEDNRLTISRAVGRFGYRATYLLSDVTDIRVLEDPPTVRGILFGRSLNGRLAFDVGTQTRRFGDFLDIPEAVKIGELLHAHGIGRATATNAGL